MTKMKTRMLLGGVVAGWLLAAGAIPAAHADTSAPKVCNQEHPCYNGHVPSYADDDCWPGAIYCPPAGTTDDSIVGDEDDDVQLVGHGGGSHGGWGHKKD